jgi:hypothetical protein
MLRPKPWSLKPAASHDAVAWLLLPRCPVLVPPHLVVACAAFELHNTTAVQNMVMMGMCVDLAMAVSGVQCRPVAQQQICFKSAPLKCINHLAS